MRIEDVLSYKVHMHCRWPAAALAGPAGRRGRKQIPPFHHCDHECVVHLEQLGLIKMKCMHNFHQTGICWKTYLHEVPIK